MSAANKTSPVHLNDAASGLSQQMVFWGHDVRHPAGNCLERHGLRRSPSPGLKGTSCYSMAWEDGLIQLHGATASWTAAAGGTGMVFHRDVRRIELWSGPQPPVPGHSRGLSGSIEQRQQAFQPFRRWLVAYEQWIHATCGSEWRTGCWRALKRLPKGKPWLQPASALKWWELAATSHPPRPRDLQAALQKYRPAPIHASEFSA